MVYLALFRLGEIGSTTLKQLITDCTTPSRISEMLKFIFDPASAQEHLVPRWKRLFDDAYIDGVVVGNIKRHSESMLQLAMTFEGDGTAGTLHHGTTTKGVMSRKASMSNINNNNNNNNEPSDGIIVLEGTLASTATKSKIGVSPRAVGTTKGVTVTYERHDPLPRPKPVKDTATDAQKKAVELAKNGAKASTLAEEAAAENRRKEEESRQRMQPFDMKTEKIKARRSRAVQEMLEEEKARAQPQLGAILSIDEVRAKLMKEPDSEVRLTNAALLREDKFYERKEAEALAILRKKETEMRDDTEFREWQRKMLEQDDEEQRRMVWQRKIDMRLADEAAKDARRAHVHHNQDNALQFREEMSEERRRQHEANMMELVSLRMAAEEQSTEMQERLQKAKEKVNQDRQSGATNVRDESQQNELQLAMNFELERQRKADLIREFKEAHTQNSLLREGVVDGVKGFVYVRPLDKENTVGLGILNEMSLAQLEREIVRVKEENVALEKMRRDAILETKSIKESEASERLDRVQNARQRVRAEKEAQRMKRREAEAKARRDYQEVEEKQLRELREKLAQHREAKQKEDSARLQAERARRVANQLLSADAGAMEEKRWAEIERGAQNRAVVSQNERLASQRTRNAVDTRQTMLRESNIERDADVRQQHRAWGDEEYASRRVVQQSRNEREQSLKRGVVEIERTRLATIKGLPDPRSQYSSRSAPSSQPTGGGLM
eukprot:PhM_4_TR12034/c0_g1_i1/m.100834